MATGRNALGAYHAAFHGWGSLHAVDLPSPAPVRRDDRQVREFPEELTAFEILDQECQQTIKFGARRRSPR
ncbi:MAG TPA: hypothetical protein VGO22_15490 [Pseudorhizobium sp.]|jgi:hypothetical protein|nr:hypothetical protein [Pseudorhizobium sp.]